jgi:Spherulation-specific family 4
LYLFSILRLIQIVHNPGAIPDDSRLFSGADVIVVFEQPYDEYSSDASELQHLASNATNGYKRGNFCYMVNSLPSNWGKSQLENFVNEVDKDAQYLFLTNRNITDEDVYNGFGDNWNDFVDIMSSA